MFRDFISVGVNAVLDWHKLAPALHPIWDRHFQFFAGITDTIRWDDEVTYDV